MQSVSLRRLLLWRLSVLMSFVILLGGAITFALATYFAHGVFDQWLFDSASTLGAQVKATPGDMRVDLPRSALEMFEFDAVDRVFYDVVAADGRRIFGNAALPVSPTLVEPGPPVFYDANIQGRNVRVVAVHVSGRESTRRNDAAAAAAAVATAPAAAAADSTSTSTSSTSDVVSEDVIVQVAETTNKRDALVTKILLAILLPQTLLMFFAALAIWYAVTNGMKSLDDIAARLTRYAPGSSEPLVDPRAAPIEVQPLLRALHVVVDRLDEAQKSQQRFITNASHQLRTPLAALQVQAERALREPDPVKHSEALESVLKTMSRLRHLAHQILMLARAEPVANPTLELRPLDLAELVRSELEQWMDAAIAQGDDLGYDGPSSGVEIIGEPQLLHELVGNLVDNAIRYAGRDARITLALTTDPEPLLIIEDDGPGIPAPERALVLERFYRRAQSPGEGSGLGLAIAREIADRHGAELKIDTGIDDRGLKVSVRFRRMTG